MSQVPFSELPDDARVWVFAARRPLAPAEAEALLAHVDAFLDGWLAHGRPVVGGRELRYDQFLLVAADEAATGVSGCSIDALFRTLAELERELGVSLLDSSPVWCRADGQIRALTRPEFRQRVQAGALGADSVVFDNTVATLRDLRHGRWETRAGDSWHAAAFGIRAREPAAPEAHLGPLTSSSSR